MKKYCITLLSVLCVSLLNAQDVIITKNAEKIEAKIIEVSPTEIKYKKTNNLDGPTFIFYVSDVQTIIYSNGDVQLFDAKPKEVKDTPKVIKEKVEAKKTTLNLEKEKSVMADILITKKGKKIAVFIDEENNSFVKYRRVDNPNVVLNIAKSDVKRIEYKVYKTDAIYKFAYFDGEKLPSFTYQKVWVQGKKNMKKRGRYCGGDMILSEAEFEEYINMYCPLASEYRRKANNRMLIAAFTIPIPIVSLIFSITALNNESKVLPTYNRYCASMSTK